MKTAGHLLMSSARGCLAADFPKEKENNVCVQARVMYAERSIVFHARFLFVCRY